MQLLDYTEKHDGWFPKGEASPEASLSLLYRQDPWMAYILRGKTIPPDIVRERLERGELLTPETCGWHYVEGLRKGDDPRLALFWDKAGLGQFGQRLKNGAHEVHFVDGSLDYIPGEEWDQFLAAQEQLRANLKRHQ
jgi:hypothetical protein